MADELARDEPVEDSAGTSKTVEAAVSGQHEEEEEDGEDGESGDETAAAGGSSVTSKKKRKPRKKKKKATEEASVATTQPGLDPSKPIPANDIQQLLQQLALQQPNKKEGKAPDEYKFWNTQPVPKFKEPNLLQTTTGKEGDKAEGAILPSEVCKASVKPEPEKLLDGFEWCEIDLDDKEELNEFYDLLYNHYVEDTDGSFRFNYSTKFLTWALKPPGWKKEWHIGIRTASKDGKKGKLVASIAGIPVTLNVRGKTINASEINFLAIHRKLRNKRLAPVLIKEVTRRCYQNDIFQALYTAGTLLPTPVSTCRYFHRSMDWEHLYKTGFSHMPQGSSELRQKLKYKLETNTQLKGIRPMMPADIPAVRALLVRYNERFSLRQEFTDEEIAHWICSETSKDVVWAYVIEQDGRITDFVSYYLLESSVLRSKKETIRAAYLYYYATESAFAPAKGPKPKAKDVEEMLKTRLQALIHDVLILAKKDNFHVFNALTLLDNPLFLKDQKFEPGDGKLHYYLFNWRTGVMPGGVDAGNNLDATKMGGVGVVML